MGLAGSAPTPTPERMQAATLRSDPVLLIPPAFPDAHQKCPLAVQQRLGQVPQDRSPGGVHVQTRVRPRHSDPAREDETAGPFETAGGKFGGHADLEPRIRPFP